MPLTEDQFNTGISTDEYWTRLKTNQEAILEVYATVTPPKDALAFFDALETPVRLAIFTEDWCGDALTSTPSILRLAEATRGIEHRVFERDKHLDLANSFLPEHRHGTLPIFAVFDRGMAEVARFIETARELVPAVRAMNDEIRSRRLAAIDAGKSPREMTEPGRATYRRATVAHRVEHAQDWGAVVIESFTRTVREGLALPRAERPAAGGTEWPPRDT